MSEEKNVLAVIDTVYAAWARNDAEVFVEVFTEDGTSVLPGAYRAGAAEIRDRMAESFAGPLKDTHVLDETIAVRFPAEGTAIVTARNAVVFPGESDDVPADRWVVATWTLVRDGEGTWKAAAYHNSPA